ncbi:MAG: hypothetical protein M1827_004025 [Pycnora praestabilis]|nr:MAG: hypothetical protein M1827_004025 [Pycnora praestabilis]
MTSQTAQMHTRVPPSPIQRLAQSTLPKIEQESTNGHDGEAEEKSRGRRRSRGEDDGREGTEENWSVAEDGSSAGGPSRKRRRSRKGLDKKFECPQDGCGKSYSRAEHLYRHQLNHTPKQIYNCDFPDCRRSFVRQDLCARHKERHTARGSQLQRKDAIMQNASPLSPTGPFAKIEEDATKSVGSPDSTTPRGDDPVYSDAHHRPSLSLFSPPTEKKANPLSPNSTHSTGTVTGSNASPPNDPRFLPRSVDSRAMSNQSVPFHRSNSDGSYRTNNSISGNSTGGPPRPMQYTPFEGRHSSIGSIDVIGSHRSSSVSNNGSYARPPLHTSVGPTGVQLMSISSPYSSSPAPMHGYSGSGHVSSNSPAVSHGPYMPQQNFPPMTTLPGPSFLTMNQTSSSRPADAPYSNSPSTSLNSMDTTSSFSSSTQNAAIGDAIGIDQMAFHPVFGGEVYNRSPFAMADDFAAWLFNDSSMARQASIGSMSAFNDTSGMQLPGNYFPDPSMGGYYAQAVPQQHPMAVTSILDTSLPESLLSEEKRAQVIDLIEMRFNETDPVDRKQKDIMLDGDREQDNHVLSLKSMQTYIISFWYHFHPQLPILHKPTFVADKTQNLLLIAIMAIGASCLDKVHGHAVTQAGAEMSNFLAWHLRTEIFNDADFRPPAKLWVFQALLLLEIYEKMYSTRALHERAHIHHATTITLMRRGSSFLGRSAMDSPPGGLVRDEKSNHDMNGSSHTSGTNTPDDWWNHWITNEATRRAAFAAFVIDSTHATMFGHSASMVAHEMRLPLPCDEALWSATSSAEVGRVEASLHANGVKPTTFLEGLRKTLNRENVRTNSFGRTILMAGLLSVSWHMDQRDLQVNSLRVAQALGGRDKWRGALTRAFDSWKRDFDETLAQSSDPSTAPYQYANNLDEENVFESRTVLHHLAHMAMHVDIVDCQIYAGAKRLLGRAITPQDYNHAQRRMKENWAPTARARDATFYALRFLSQVLLPDEQPGSANNNTNNNLHHQRHDSNSTNSNSSTIFYSARDDFLLNRPWVLYFAALIVWSYGYALEGSITPPNLALITPDQKYRDMRAFLLRVGGVKSPDDLGKITSRNSSAGMLLVLRDMFVKTRWELLHEAAKLLTNCIDMLTHVAS